MRAVLTTKHARTDHSCHVRAAMLSEVGAVRDRNEDRAAFLVPRPDDQAESRGVLALVADGMGGHAAGDVASRLAEEVVFSTYYNSSAAPGEALSAGFQAANTAIFREAERRVECQGMGTTCVAVALVQGCAYLANVGDSRAYLLREDHLYLLSEDDSLVMQLVRDGKISRAEAERHEDRNVLLRALGTQPQVDVAAWHEGMPLKNADTILLCSDGLSDVVAEPEIRRILRKHEPDAACRALIAAAIDAGSQDNITAGVLSVTDQPASRDRDRPLRPTRTGTDVAMHR